jgi:hypothetical protein
VKIEVGHKVDFLVPKGREYNCTPVSGVVYKMTFSDVFKSYTIFVKPFNSYNLSCIMTAFPVYGDLTIYRGKVSEKELVDIQEKMVPFSGPPKMGKKTVKRGGIVIRQDAVLTPNTDYSNKGIEGYITTKKAWGRIQKTTAKMVVYHNGLEFKRCSINNVSEIR